MALRMKIIERFRYHREDLWSREVAIAKAAEDLKKDEALIRKVVAHCP